MTLSEMIDKATVQAKVGLDPQSVSTRTELVANSFIAQVFIDAAREAAKNQRTRSLLRKTKNLAFVSGEASLSTDVLTEYMADSTLWDFTDSTAFYSHVPEWIDFINTYDTRIGHYCVRGGIVIAVTQPGDTYEFGSGLSGSLLLEAPCVPAVPTLATDAIVAPAEFVLIALDALVERLRGHYVGEGARELAA